MWSYPANNVVGLTTNEFALVDKSVMHFSVIAHDALIGESYRKTLVLDIISLAGGHKLTLVAPLSNLNLTDVSRGAKANSVSRLVRKMNGKLVDNRIGVVRHKLLLVRGAGFFWHGWKVDLVDIEFLVRCQVTEHF